MVEFVKEIEGYQAREITDEELAFMKVSISQGKALVYETTYQKIGFMRSIQRYNLDADCTNKRTEITNNMTKAEINKLAENQLEPEQMIVVIVGDRVKIEVDIKALGYQVSILEL